MNPLIYLAALLATATASSTGVSAAHARPMIEAHEGTVISSIQFDAVMAAIAKGDVASLSSYLDKTVELALPGIDDIFTKEQATAKLKSFFALNPPTGFARVHGGTSKGDVGAYVIGSLSCGEKRYRVYLYGTGDAAPKIQEIRIEKQ